MVNFNNAIEDDKPQIAEWIAADPHHANQYEADYWLTGNDCFLACCLDDESGPVMYIRFDREDGDILRLRTQFAPEDQVSKERTGKAILEAIPGFIAGVQKEYGIKGIIFETENPALAGFMRKHFGFKSAGEKDYLLMFPGIN